MRPTSNDSTCLVVIIVDNYYRYLLRMAFVKFPFVAGWRNRGGMYVGKIPTYVSRYLWRREADGLQAEGDQPTDRGQRCHYLPTLKNSTVYFFFWKFQLFTTNELFYRERFRLFMENVFFFTKEFIYCKYILYSLCLFFLLSVTFFNRFINVSLWIYFSYCKLILLLWIIFFLLNFN